MAQRLTVIALIIIVTLGYTLFQSYILDKKLADKSVAMKNSVIRELPDIELKRFSDEKNISLKKLAEGKSVFVHFWATWCGPCEKELPELLELMKKMEKNTNVIFLLVAVNDQRKDLKKFFDKYKISQQSSFLFVDNDSHFQKSFGTFRLPETFLFKRGGRLLRRFQGPQKWADDKLTNLLQSL